MTFRISVIVCAHNEAQYLPGCLHSLLAQSRIPDEIHVINNASTDSTRAVADAIPHVRVADEPRKGLVVARETGRVIATGDILVYLDADCRAPLMCSSASSAGSPPIPCSSRCPAHTGSTTGTGGGGC